ncbi:Transposase DDE domain protein [Sporotomaculum syntrophicum]|uniref:Transposase DDE domain protein n=1 Tax=Sporotomaculum syntrophicum TaxID=182264 RepID=A0A9D2WNH0_9FIRM|nr:IS1634 family transposase [Sporotomaculum syntrophicum]KAF1084707.1 Transposase DDE domain protein [Sporotomaculum syntrophicum]
MRLSLSKSKNATSLYVIKDVIENNKRTSKIVEKLGTFKELEKKLNGQDPIEWAKEYIAELNRLEEKGKEPVVIAKYSPSKLIKKGEQRTFNGGYLFLQKLYHKLGLDKICSEISGKYKFEYNLDSILSRLLYGRILFPSSKLSTYELSSELLEPPDFELHQVYRALEVIAKETDFIQASLYRNSLAFSKRNTGILYYDCTNYFFEIEQEEGLKQYGFAKDHKPNPIVQMGLFMDGDGVPLAFSITEGNLNEQLTLKPLEKKILSDFKLSRFIVCTDAGLASKSNRLFNDKADRAFITTQSIKKLKSFLKEWALDPEGWRMANDTRIYDIRKLDENKYKEKIFYKERWIKEGGLEQKLIVTYSIKYKNYQSKVRVSQVERALKTLDTNPSKIKKHRQNDYKRFIEKKTCTDDGEVAENEVYSLNTSLIESEAVYDGFYAVCTNLDEDAAEIAQINRRRWEIEECFRILKSEFKARPVYLKRDDRITAHFTTCFIALVIYRVLEKKLNEQFTSDTIIRSLRKMNFKELKNEGYEPIYTRTDFTDALHEAFGFRTDYEIVTLKHIKNIFKLTKTR